MPPTRRYLRLTAHTVLEVRIYLDNPADTHRWLLHPSRPALPSVIAAVRPLVLPKLQEENARTAGKGGSKGAAGKKKGWKDTVHTDDFEVAVFLTETSVRHSILKKEKNVRVKAEMQRRSGSTDGNLAETREEPVLVDEGAAGAVKLRQESSQDGEDVRSGDIPTQNERSPAGNQEGLFVSDDEDDDSATPPPPDTDDKKKLALDTTYDGFSIYGRILCLVVKRKMGSKGTPAGGSGQATIEDWISSTQAGVGGMMGE